MRRLTLSRPHLGALRHALFPSSGHEHVAYVLCGQAGSDRYLSHEVFPLPSQHVISSSPSHVTASTATLRRLLKRAASEDLGIAVVHSHRPGPAVFSPQDDTDEPKLVELVRNRNGKASNLLSVILAESGEIAAREWHTPTQFEPVSVLALDERISLYSSDQSVEIDCETYSRQLLALGPAFQQALSSLRIVIVGAGATGSAVATLLARLGARHVVLVDNDIVERSNLNRLHGAGPNDAAQRRLKVDALADYLKSFRPDIEIETYAGLVNDEQCRSAITASDVIFGCTDDHDGRLWLNRVSYFYNLPLIDMGIGIDLSTETPPKITEAAARVTVTMPGQPCLLCRGVIDLDLARADCLRRESPQEYERQLDEAYVRGGNLINPAVVSYTTEVACMAVDELIERLTGYRRLGPIDHRIRKFRLGEDKRPGFKPPTDRCPICATEHYWGRGDVTPFLDRIAA